MKVLRFIALSYFALLWQTTYAQNAFLNREYWKAQPSIAEIQKQLTENNQNSLSELNENQFDPVVYAIIEKNPTETIQFLLKDKGNDVNKITHDGRTYLFWAAYAGNLDLMRYLVEKGAKTDLIDEHGNTVLIFAASNGQMNTAIYDFCIEHGADIKKETNTAGANALLLIAPYFKDLDLLPYFLSKGLDLKSTDDLGNGIFNYAARNGNTNVLESLIRRGVNYQNLNDENGNAILFACQGSRFVTNTLAVYEFLVSKGIKANVTTTKGTTPLHILAGRCKDPQIIRFFMEQGVNPNAADHEGNTPLHIAASSQSDLAITQLLLARTADINLPNKEGASPLCLAMQYNSIETVELLLHKEANTRVTDANGNTLSYYLMKSYDPKNALLFDKKWRLFTSRKMDLKTPQGDGNTLFHLAAQKNDLALLEKVQALGGVDINAVNNEGLTALHIAAMKTNTLSILEFLVKNGADPQIQTGFEETTYQLAMENELLVNQVNNLNFLK